MVSVICANVLFLGAKVLFLGAKVLFLGAKVLFLEAKVLFLGAKVLFLGAKILFFGSKGSLLGVKVRNLGAKVLFFGQVYTMWLNCSTTIYILNLHSEILNLCTDDWDHTETRQGRLCFTPSRTTDAIETRTFNASELRFESCAFTLSKTRTGTSTDPIRSHTPTTGTGQGQGHENLLQCIIIHEPHPELKWVWYSIGSQGLTLPLSHSLRCDHVHIDIMEPIKTGSNHVMVPVLHSWSHSACLNHCCLY